jgi:hypothetical protein
MSGTSNCLQSRHRPVYSGLLLEARRVQYLCRPFVVTSRPYRYRAVCRRITPYRPNSRRTHETSMKTGAQCHFPLPTAHSLANGCGPASPRSATFGGSKRDTGLIVLGVGESIASKRRGAQSERGMVWIDSFLDR